MRPEYLQLPNTVFYEDWAVDFYQVFIQPKNVILCYILSCDFYE